MIHTHIASGLLSMVILGLALSPKQIVVNLALVDMSKEEGILISPAKLIRMMSNELQAGSFKVIAEARESGNVGIYRPNRSAHVQLIKRILANVALEDILWEAPKKPQQVWFIRQFGANVNLGNIGPNDLIPLECLRLGLRGDTFFEHLPEALADGKRLAPEEVTEED